MIPAALTDLAQHGFTEVHDLYTPPWLGAMLANLDQRRQLSMDIQLVAPLDSIEAELDRARTYTTPRIRLAGAKTLADGKLNSRTAWMLHPYADPIPGMPTGKVVTPPDQIRAAIERTQDLGTGLAVHAIGDGAVLDATEDVATRTQRPLTGVRIEHCELIDERDVPRFARLGITASVQPCHLLADVDALNRHVPHRLDRVLPLRELDRIGADAQEEPDLRVRYARGAPRPGGQHPGGGPSPPPGARFARSNRPFSADLPGQAWACFRP